MVLDAKYKYLAQCKVLIFCYSETCKYNVTFVYSHAYNQYVWRIKFLVIEAYQLINI